MKPPKNGFGIISKSLTTTLHTRNNVMKRSKYITVMDDLIVVRNW